jgi:hypothetical protein
MYHDGRVLDVIPTSGKFCRKVQIVVRKLQTCVEKQDRISDIIYTYTVPYITAVIDLVLRFSLRYIP